MGALLALLLFAGQADAAPAADEPPPKPAERAETLRKVVVSAIRNCPIATTPDEIVVCSRDRGVAEAYRLPRLDPRYDRKVESGQASLAGGGQALGSGNCSTGGSAGQTGCSLAEANAWGQYKKEAKKSGQWFPW